MADNRMAMTFAGGFVSYECSVQNSFSQFVYSLLYLFIYLSHFYYIIDALLGWLVPSTIYLFTFPGRTSIFIWSAGSTVTEVLKERRIFLV